MIWVIENDLLYDEVSRSTKRICKELIINFWDVRVLEIFAIETSLKMAVHYEWNFYLFSMKISHNIFPGSSFKAQQFS